MKRLLICVFSLAYLSLFPQILHAQNNLDSLLVGHYPLDGSLVDAKNINHGTLHGPVPVADRWGNPAGAVHFDGVDDYGLIPHHSQYTFDVNSNPFTVNVWLCAKEPYLAPLPGSRIMEKKFGNSEYPFTLQVSGPEKITQFVTHDGSVVHIQVLDTTYSAWDSTWHMFTCVVEMGIGYTYFDGQLMRMEYHTVTGTTGNTYAITLGNSNTNYARPFHGSMDEIRFYTRALSATEVWQLYQLGVGIDEDSEKLSFSVYPNPVEQELNLRVPGAFESGSIEVLNSLGQVLIQQDIYDVDSPSILVAHLPAGLYIVSLDNGRERLFARFLKR